MSPETSPETLRIAVPSGAGVEELLEQSGYRSRKKSSRAYKADSQMIVQGRPVHLEIIPFKAMDVPGILRDTHRRHSPERIHVAVTDQDILAETSGIKRLLEVVCVIPGGSNGGRDTVQWRCLVPEESPIQTVQDLEGKKVLTKLPLMTRSWLRQNDVHSDVVRLGGSAEAALKTNVCDAVVDVVDSGQSRDENHLREVADVFESRRVLVANKHSLQETWMRQSLFQLGTSIVGSRLSKKTVQIWANIPSDAVQTLTSNLLFAGGKSPMLNDLGNGWHEFMASISSDLEQDASAQLLALGADDIDVVPLSKSMRVATMREYFGPALLKLLPEPR